MTPSELVERLRRDAEMLAKLDDNVEFAQAADWIEHLSAELAALRERLRLAEDFCNAYDNLNPTGPRENLEKFEDSFNAWREARDAK